MQRNIQKLLLITFLFPTIVSCNEPMLASKSIIQYQLDVEVDSKMPLILDIDKDGSGDFLLLVNSIPVITEYEVIYPTKLRPVGRNLVAISSTKKATVKKLNKTDLISSRDLLFTKYIEPLAFKTIHQDERKITWLGEWLNEDDFYIGFAFELIKGSQANMHYGYMKLKFNRLKEIIRIKEITYNLIPGNPVEIGEYN